MLSVEILGGNLFLFMRETISCRTCHLFLQVSILRSWCVIKSLIAYQFAPNLLIQKQAENGLGQCVRLRNHCNSCILKNLISR